MIPQLRKLLDDQPAALMREALGLAALCILILVGLFLPALA